MIWQNFFNLGNEENKHSLVKHVLFDTSFFKTNKYFDNIVYSDKKIKTQIDFEFHLRLNRKDQMKYIN